MSKRNSKLLEVRDLKTYFYTELGVVKAVDGVDFELYPGETLGIVGESGCGKSVTSLSIMKLVPQPLGKIVGGSILFNGADLAKFSNDEMKKVRGNDISMIFQEPMTSLNPVYMVGDQIAETIILHKKVSKMVVKNLRRPMDCGYITIIYQIINPIQEATASEIQ